MKLKRCFGDGKGQELYASYHDTEWGVPVHDKKHLFECLILEGAQAGLSWELILKRRQAYRRAFHTFDPVAVALMSDSELEALMKDPGLIRNRRKLLSVRHNARIFLEISNEFGSFDQYVWAFVGGKPIQNRWKQRADVPSVSVEGNALTSDLKRRGMRFVGPKIVYSFMQAVGMINDHLITCQRHSDLASNYNELESAHRPQ